MKKNFKPCDKCKGTGKTKINRTKPILMTKETKKMKLIMKRHNLSQSKLAKILKISQPTVSAWFYPNKNNTYRKIKKKYFEFLKLKGII